MAVVAHEEHPLFAAGVTGNRAAPEETAVDSNGNGTQLGWRHEFRQELSVLAGHADHRIEADARPNLVVELHHPVVPLPGPGPWVAGSLESLGRIGVLHLVEGEDLPPNGVPGDVLGHLKIFGLDDVEPPAPEHLADFGGHLGARELIVLGRPGYPQVPDRNRQAPDRPGLHSQRLQPFQQLSLAFVLDKGNQRDPMFGSQDFQIVIHALGAAVEAETRGIGRKHQYVQGSHGQMGFRGSTKGHEEKELSTKLHEGLWRPFPSFADHRHDGQRIQTTRISEGFFKWIIYMDGQDIQDCLRSLLS